MSIVSPALCKMQVKIEESRHKMNQISEVASSPKDRWVV